MDQDQETWKHDAPTGPVASPEGRIGPYELLAELGRGGMGVVYLAVRADEQYRKQVALKVVRAGAERDEVLRGFRRERQILAGLEHDHIARFLDGGSTEDGLPYFVMEYVQGQRIDEYCTSRGLSTLERVRLFRDVCSAIEYAHRNLIVHRDLKPGNILVTAAGVAKLLDFGIAKLLAVNPQGETATATGLAMTPAYASPEQVRGEAVTTASDVYSLGVVLYELLTGQLPYRLEAANPLALMRAVCEEQPEKPSTVVGRHTALAPTEVPGQGPPAAPKGETPQRVRSRLKGDLDTIVLTALRKEPAQRYSSVEMLSEDLRRFSVGLPIRARKPTLGYRARKFVERHWAGVAGALVAAALLAGFVANHFAQAARIRSERDKAAKVSAFLVELFKVSDPGEARGSSITAREILDQGAERIKGELDENPEVRATLMDTIGSVYKSLGLYERSAALLREAIAERRGLLGEHPDLALSLHNLATVLYHQGKYDEAEALFRETLAMRRKLLGPDHPDLAKTLNNMAIVTMEKGDSAAAEALYRETLALRRRVLGPEHPQVASSLHNLGILLTDKGDYAQAEQVYREALAIERKHVGEDHPDVARSIHNLAVVLHRAGKLPEAEKLYRQGLAARRKLLGEEHPEVADSLGALASVLIDKSDAAAAEPLIREALRIAQKALGPEHVVLAGLILNLGEAQRARGELLAAEESMRRALAQYRKVLPEGHPSTAEAESLLGACLVAQGRYPEAEALLAGSYPRIHAARSARSRSTLDARARLVKLYEAWGRPEKAREYAAAP